MKTLVGLELGTFRVGRRIGAGGMSEVFEGHHHISGQKVALKITNFEGRTDAMRRAFTAEISAMARFYHPGIVRVHDWGSLPDGSGNWFAMDWSPGGALALEDIQSWADLKELLVTVLRAFAHAHARRIVHRDVKPGNVLVFPDANRFRLADFGLAHSRSVKTDTRVLGAVAGTPIYMAPEQSRGQWREFGPWTDLYALGCLAYEMASGRPPFVGKTTLQIAMAHIQAPRPSLTPRFPVPEGFEAWVQALMAADWLHRPRVAPIALRMLEELGEPVGEIDESLDRSGFYAETELPQTLLFSMELEPTNFAQTLVDARPAGGSPSAPTPFDSSMTLDTPMPVTWRTETGDDASLTGSGASLFSIRRTRLVGNEGARDLVWNTLREVCASNVPRVIVLESEDERELAVFGDWVAEEVRETTDLRVLHIESHSDTREFDFGRALLDIFHAHRLSGPSLREHLERVLTSWGIRDSEWLEDAARVLERTASGDNHDGVEVNIFYEFLQRAAAVRPLVVVVNSFREVTDIWTVARQFQAIGALPVFFVLTREQGAPSTYLAHKDLVQDPQTIAIRLEQLGLAAAEVMVDSYMRFEPELRRRVCDLAASDASHAVDVIRTGIRFNLLTPTVDGYRLREGIQLSKSFDELAEIRLGILRDRFPRAARVITALAAWGEPLTPSLLNSISTTILGEELSNAEFDELLKHDFVRRAEGRHDFDSQRMKSVLASEVGADDLERLVVRASRAEPTNMRGRLRYGRLLVALGAAEEGLGVVFDALNMDGRDLRLSAAWRPWVEEHLHKLEDVHPHRGEYFALKTRLSLSMGESEDFESYLNDPSVKMRPRAYLEILYAQGVWTSNNGKHAEGREILRRVANEGSGVPRVQGWALTFLSWIQSAVDGDAEGGEATALNAVEVFLEAGATWDAAQAMAARARAAAVRGDYESAIERYSRAIECAEQDRVRRGFLTRARLERSGVFVGHGEFEDALADARDAWRFGRWTHRHFIGPQSVQFATCLALTGDVERARGVLSEAERMLSQTDAVRRETYQEQVRQGRLFVAAIAGDAEEWDGGIGAVRDALVPRELWRAVARSWEARGDHARAEQARQFAGG